MKVQLICNPDKKQELINMLQAKGLEIADDAEYIFYQKDLNNKEYTFGKESNENMSLIEYKTVLYFESRDKVMMCITDTGEFEVKKKLYELEKVLALKEFIRVNKSMIVNIMMIKKIIPWIGMKYVLVMKNDEKIDVNRTYFSNFKNRLGL